MKLVSQDILEMSGHVTGLHIWRCYGEKEINITFIRRAKWERWGKILSPDKSQRQGKGNSKSVPFEISIAGSSLLPGEMAQQGGLELHIMIYLFIYLFIYSSSAKMNFKTDNEVWNPTLGYEELLRQEHFPFRDNTCSACMHKHTAQTRLSSTLLKNRTICLASTLRNKMSKS